MAKERSFAEVAPIRGILGKTFHGHHVKVIPDLPDSLFFTEGDSFAAFSFRESAGRGRYGHGPVSQSSVGGFQKKSRVYAAGKGDGHASEFL